jgi:phosphatidylglycerol phospholipase C
MSLSQSRQYFFNTCHGFSIMYEALASPDGQAFIRNCKDAGKNVCVWTVNGKEEMRQCARWGVGSVISDKPEIWRGLKAEVSLKVI